MTQANPPMPHDTSWARHLDYLEAGGEPASGAASKQAAGIGMGLAVCAVLAGAAALLEVGTGNLLAGRTLNAAMFAMLLGIAVGNAGNHAGINTDAMRPGARWIVRIVLPLGIMLLGARLRFSDLLGVGLRGLLLSIGVVALSLVVLHTIARWWGLPGKLTTLLAVGNGICGGSAVVAVAPAIEADEEDVAISVATVALLGLVGMLALPVIGAALGMDAVSFGTWSGLAIQQTPQVIAAGFAHGTEAGEVATVVKLVRISLLAPAVVLVGLTYRMRFQKDRASGPLQLRGLVPSFVFGLVLLAGITSVGFFPEVTISLGSESALGPVGATLNTQSLAIGASKLCLVLAMAAVGLETRWASLRKTGPAAFGAAAVGAIVVTTTAALAISWL
ncbi:MAG: putative sulfate exporter family transporter [bacterium]|nr:putative sulfate exporter family transporter [bacterium]